MKYLKLFKTTAAYDKEIDTLGFPNVSYCEDNKEVHYNLVPPPFFAKLTLNDGEVVKLQGSGELTQSRISQYQTTVVSAEIGELCTSIGERAFQGCSSLTSVTIPDSVTTIGNSAFSSCSGLTNINIPNSVTSIGNSTFQYCSGLTRVTIPNNVTSIDQYAFQNCTNLTSVTIGSGVTSIGLSAFKNCTKLVSVACNATTAPAITHTTFLYVKNYGTLTVPSDSTGYDVWMGTGYYYLGYYHWTKFEQ